MHKTKQIIIKAKGRNHKFIPHARIIKKLKVLKISEKNLCKNIFAFPLVFYVFLAKIKIRTPKTKKNFIHIWNRQRCRKIREKEEKLNSDLKIFDHAKYWITITCRKLDDFRWNMRKFILCIKKRTQSTSNNE